MSEAPLHPLQEPRNRKEVRVHRRIHGRKHAALLASWRNYTFHLVGCGGRCFSGSRLSLSVW
jgi:hypothetical protein